MLLTLSFNPRTMDEIPITTDTPMTIPSTVNPDRILLPRRVSNAMRKISRYSPSRIMISLSQFLPQEQEKNLHLVSQRRKNRPQLHRRRHSNQRGNYLRQHDSHRHSQRPAN